MKTTTTVHATPAPIRLIGIEWRTPLRYRRGARERKGRTAMRRDLAHRVLVPGRPEQLSSGAISWIAPSGARRSPQRRHCQPRARDTIDRARSVASSSHRRIRSVTFGAASGLPTMGADRRDRCGLDASLGRFIAYVLLADRVGPAVHEPSSTPYRAKAAQPPPQVVRATPSRLRPGSRPVRSRVRLHLKPGQKGTRQLAAQYGDRLVCVRYRYDPDRKKRFKTVEIIVGARDWQPPPPRLARDQIVAVRVAFDETDLRERVKRARGAWNRPRRVWQLAYAEALALGLGDRIVAGPASIDGCPGSTGRHLRGDAGKASR